MNEFIDPVMGRMVAEPVVEGCAGCVYVARNRCPDVLDGRAMCSPAYRDDGRSIIWVPAADAPRAPKPVRLTDEQIDAIEDEHWSGPGAGATFRDFARIVEAAVIRANNLETPE